ncbi:hypothetical protein K438DRAFT_1502723, partial [Mycena galopus ATCC 62051]
KAQTCSRCNKIKYNGEGNKDNHKLKYCSDGFKVKLSDGDLAARWLQPAGIFTDGTQFHPRVFLAQVCELYSKLVIEDLQPHNFTVEQDVFYELLGKRVHV